MDGQSWRQNFQSIFRTLFIFHTGKHVSKNDYQKIMIFDACRVCSACSFYLGAAHKSVLSGSRKTYWWTFWGEGGMARENHKNLINLVYH